jgi:hypothetical protein
MSEFANQRTSGLPIPRQQPEYHDYYKVITTITFKQGARPSRPPALVGLSPLPACKRCYCRHSHINSSASYIVKIVVLS